MLVVLEATGTSWIRHATPLAQAGFAVSVITPSQAHAFAKALLKRAKTDAIDAQTLAALGARLQPAPWTPPPAIYAELPQRLAQRDALVALRLPVRNQRHALIQHPVVSASVRDRMDTLMQTLTDQIAAVEAELAPTLQQDAAWAAAAARLQTITGVGLLTARWLLVTTLNFTLCATPAAATSSAGLAPHLRQSGTRVRGRTAIGHAGKARVRRALYLATLRAAQHNPVIHAFYTRVRAAGKPPKVARCAAARKLLPIAWAGVTKDQDVDPTYGADAAVEGAPKHLTNNTVSYATRFLACPSSSLSLRRDSSGRTAAWYVSSSVCGFSPLWGRKTTYKGVKSAACVSPNYDQEMAMARQNDMDGWNRRTFVPATVPPTTAGWGDG